MLLVGSVMVGSFIYCATPAPGPDGILRRVSYQQGPPVAPMILRSRATPGADGIMQLDAVLLPIASLLSQQGLRYRSNVHLRLAVSVHALNFTRTELEPLCPEAPPLIGSWCRANTGVPRS